MVEAELISPRERHRNAVVNQKRQRRSHARHHHPVFTRRREAAEVGFINLLVGRRSVSVTRVLAQRHRSLINRRAAIGVHDREASRRDSHLAQTAEVIANCRLLGVRGHIAFLVHVQRRAIAQRIGCCGKQRRGRPERAVWICDLNCLIVGNRRGKLQIEAIVNAQSVTGQWRVKRTALEASRLDGHSLAVHRDGELAQRGQRQIAAGVHKVPVRHRRWIQRLGVDEVQFEQCG